MLQGQRDGLAGAGTSKAPAWLCPCAHPAPTLVPQHPRMGHGGHWVCSGARGGDPKPCAELSARPAVAVLVY